MYRLIKNIKGEVRSNRWANNKGAQFEFDIEKIHYRLIEITPDLKSFVVGLTEQNDSNCPVVAKGFLAYLIRNWGKKEIEIYQSYYSSCFANYERIETKKPGSFMRNLNVDFYPLHVSKEKEFVVFSKQIKPYLSEPEIKLINQYIKAYFIYIEQMYSPKGSKEKNSTENHPENKLSVSDWCIIFYYIDEAGTKKGDKIERMEKFIEENNVISQSGTVTTRSNFRKEYYEIENRINARNNKKPLPPKRIENILHYLKNNFKALQTAKSDIERLTYEIEENERNTY